MAAILRFQAAALEQLSNNMSSEEVLATVDAVVQGHNTIACSATRKGRIAQPTRRFRTARLVGFLPIKTLFGNARASLFAYSQNESQRCSSSQKSSEAMMR